MKVIFLGKFSRDLDDLKDNDLKDGVRDAIEFLERASTLKEIPNVKKMTGFKDAFRIRIGDYRLGFYYRDGELHIARFLHRSKIYRVFP